MTTEESWGVLEGLPYFTQQEAGPKPRRAAYELWKVQRKKGKGEEALLVQFLGHVETLQEARGLAWESRPGHYRLCDSRGEVERFSIKREGIRDVQQH